MRVISVINLKGGVGKTFTTGNLGYILNQVYGKSVLLVDNDKQGNLSKLYGAYQEEVQCDTARLLSKSYKNIADLAIRVPGTENLDVIAANMSLLPAEWELNRSEDADQVMRYMTLRESGYDFVIIDNPPDMGLSVINALVASDDVIVPTKIDKWALQGMEIISNQIQEIKQINAELDLMGILVTMYRNNDTNNVGIESLKENGYKVFDTAIRYSDKAVDSTFYDKPIVQYSPRSGTARTYKKFVAEYLEKIGQGGTQ